MFQYAVMAGTDDLQTSTEQMAMLWKSTWKCVSRHGTMRWEGGFGASVRVSVPALQRCWCLPILSYGIRTE